MNSAPPMDQVLGSMLATLSKYLHFMPSPLPEPVVSIVTLKERPLAIGNSLGYESRGSFPIIELKGVRLEAKVSFQLWGGDLKEVDTEFEALHERLLAARDDLRAEGFLTLSAGGASSSEQIDSLHAWRKTADFNLLYEFHYEDKDGTQSIITRIPIEIDGEYAVVSDDIVRWDNQGAPVLEASGLTIRGAHIGALFILSFLPPGWDGGEVSISSFISGINRERKFNNVRMFRDAFDFEMDGGYVFSWGKIPGIDDERLIEFLTKKFGIDWAKTAKIEKIDNGKTIKVSGEENSLSLKLNDENTKLILEIDDNRRDEFIAKMENGELNIYDSGNFKTVGLGGQSYFAGKLAFPSTDFPDQIVLRKREDVFRISYSAPSFDSNAVVYLRLLNKS